MPVSAAYLCEKESPKSSLLRIAVRMPAALLRGQQIALTGFGLCPLNLFGYTFINMYGFSGAFVHGVLIVILHMKIGPWKYYRVECKRIFSLHRAWSHIPIADV